MTGVGDRPPVLVTGLQRGLLLTSVVVGSVFVVVFLAGGVLSLIAGLVKPALTAGELFLSPLFAGIAGLVTFLAWRTYRRVQAAGACPPSPPGVQTVVSVRSRPTVRAALFGIAAAYLCWLGVRGYVALLAERSGDDASSAQFAALAMAATLVWMGLMVSGFPIWTLTALGRENLRLTTAGMVLPPSRQGGRWFVAWPDLVEATCRDYEARGFSAGHEWTFRARSGDEVRLSYPAGAVPRPDALRHEIGRWAPHARIV